MKHQITPITIFFVATPPPNTHTHTDNIVLIAPNPLPLLLEFFKATPLEPIPPCQYRHEISSSFKHKYMCMDKHKITVLAQLHVNNKFVNTCVSINDQSFITQYFEV